MNNLIKNMDFDISRVLNNKRISKLARKELRSKLFDTNEFIDKYDLNSYFAGLSSFKQVEEKIPSSAIIHGKRYTRSKLKKSMLKIELLNDKNKIKDLTALKINFFIDNYDKKTKTFKFRKVTNKPLFKKISEKSFVLLSLMKWQLYSNSRDKRLTTSIKNGLSWLKNNLKNVDFFLNPDAIYETTFKTSEFVSALQTLLFADIFTIGEKTIFDDIYIKKLLELQCRAKNNNLNGRWPSELLLNNAKWDKNYDRDVATTMAVSKLLLEYLYHLDKKDPSLSNDIKKSLKRSYRWLLSKQNHKNGSWNIGGTDSIENTAKAVQILTACKNYFSDSNIDKATWKALDWIGNQFCLTPYKHDMTFAWSREDNNSQPCEKNTSLMIHALLKANVPYDSFIIKKAILWLMEHKPKSKFNNIYIYNALFDYLNSIDIIAHRKFLRTIL